MRRRRRSPFELLEEQAQLAGMVARIDTICGKCHEDILKDTHRIVPIDRSRHHWAHVTCMNGFSDE